ncbi:MAG: hypothetical protein MI861_09215 [Pirellulales bacterium]|nr:hypothetical protein [Pirellulales bacterium]
MMFSKPRNRSNRQRLIALLLLSSCGVAGCNTLARPRLTSCANGGTSSNCPSGCGCRPSWLASLASFFQPCPDYPLGCMPPDNGATVNNYFGAMGYQAEADDFVIYQYEWTGDTAAETADLRHHLRRVLPRMAIEPFPLVIQASNRQDLDTQRRARVIELARAELENRVRLGEPIVPIRHLGPANQLMHLPQTGAGYSGHTSQSSFTCPPVLPDQRADELSSQIVHPENLAVVIDQLESRVVISDSAAEGQLSDAFARRLGFSPQTSQGGGQGGGNGGGQQGGQFGGGGGRR